MRIVMLRRSRRIEPLIKCRWTLRGLALVATMTFAGGLLVAAGAMLVGYGATVAGWIGIGFGTFSVLFASQLYPS